MSFPIEPTRENIAAARDFVFQKWNERAAERGLAPRADLSGSCKFSALFAQAVFATSLRGNIDHEFGVLEDGTVLDLNAHARDVRDMDDPWVHDTEFWDNAEHLASLDSCRARVSRWVAEFEEIVFGPSGPDQDPSM